MSSGLLALLDDVSALVKASATSLDDISTQVSKTATKVSGIVIDDAAVTPKYVVGLDPSRELSIIFNIAKKSVINKLIFLGPITLLLGFYLPQTITPILMLGGSYLCLEGFHKVLELFGKKHEQKNTEELEEITPEQLEEKRISSAVRTDLILSAEIMAITYSTLIHTNLINQIIIMAIVAIAITFVVYGSVAIIVKMDDLGLYMAQNSSSELIKKLGHFIVKSMPTFLKILSLVGTFAMLLVGFEIIVHGVAFLEHFFHTLNPWVNKILIIVSGVIWGFIVHCLVTLFNKAKKSFVSK